jgi:hypothetical protein
MDGLIIAFVGRLVVSLVLALVGFMAVQYGYNLFVSGVGLKKDKGQLRIRAPQVKLEMVTSSVGGVLMLTSLGWGSLTYLSLPTLSSGRVASSDTIIRALALGDTTLLTAADKIAISSFVGKAEQILDAELFSKQLDLLRDVVPQVSQVAFLLDMSDPDGPSQWKQAGAAARSKGLQPQLLDVRKPEDLRPAFDNATRQRADALVVVSAPLMYAQRGAIADLTAEHRLPAIYPSRDFVVAGGFISYGVSYLDLFRRAAFYADHIRNGFLQADLPVQRLTKFQLAINLKAAKTLGLAVPPPLLASAEEVVE